ncbi:MlaE family lipid ABC transporter permease subunit [Spirulina sp. 06S082]|uniref:MlaE family ABC transporter permease n=1 Tax=Spirulina sp. 06S082 TaxID=3110248 RepID=UPI002B1FD300|nr:MlaE family lipid ABC transporter permease subunit [Spirulina sp. 06S082]MEA5472230.1 MlaE family lipid ABC transporter permease subunit [Spirulina sp. 06S082]
MSNPESEDFVEQSWLWRFVMALLLVGQLGLRLFKGRIYPRAFLEQLAKAGPRSLLPVILIAISASAIFTIQTARELNRFGAINALGGAFALAFCRELGPVLTASIVAGQVGSAYAAELGAMRVTEQIDALMMLKTDPIDYLVLPRAIACCVMLPLLSICAIAVGIISGMLVARQFYHLNPWLFLQSVRSFLTPLDLLAVLLKGFLFGIVVSAIGCSWGLTTQGGAKEVGQSSTNAVVTTWIAIFMLDFLLSLVLFKTPIL